ncbi:threonine/serine exporter family protein [Proteiniborus sp. MB09-C3]|uniref:threonine/serine exporter family protein n=1 Tax=Proteiniborus sp. MB09-C3 TaxID=3050072 RepID=UPI002555931A|nr:threonine/serine exporter family protein [Proteiniborus sp. MB09-C3]WIV10773.1 threonine/serine exporter family protein [Proteiniborus sp. MB09-C3]
MFYIKQFVYAFLSTAGFGVFFNIPKDSIIKSSLGGAMSWVVYIISVRLFSSSIGGTLLAAITVGFLGEFMAKHFKKPATIFIIPGIVPLVPGAGMYYTMLEVINKDFISAAELGTEAIFIALAIAIGIIVSSSFSRALLNQKTKR